MPRIYKTEPMNKKVSLEPAQRAVQQAWNAYNTGKYAEALKLAQTAKRANGNLPDAYYLEALALSGLGRNADAKTLAEASMNRFPKHPGFLGLVGTLEIQLSNHAKGAALVKRSLELQPNSPHLWQVYGGAMFTLGDYYESRVAGERAAAMLPNDPIAVGNYAAALRESGSTMEALPIFRRACSLDPTHRVNRSNLLFSLLYDENVSAEELRREATSWAETLARTPIDPRPLEASEGKRIRIGVLSNDLRRHACAYYLIPLIANLDREYFEVHLFSLSGVVDFVTEKIQKYADGYHEVSKMTEAEVVRAVRAQRCDVMIDLGGYTGASPLQYMVHRLAPIQMAWLGYPSTTGMKEIDYRITDPIGDPEGFERNYTEKLLRAPLFCAYHPHVTSPLKIYDRKYRVADTPALQNGYITFGSCNHIAKLGPKTMRLWSAVLARCPNSKLLVEAGGLERESAVNMIVARMEEYGIDTSRVMLLPRDTVNQYITYNMIDIALDTAPVTGGTTTCDTLWMGVPIVTIAGDTFHQRVSAPFLHITGLEELMCDSEDRYVEMACELASDVGRLNDLRHSLRARVEQGPMCDGNAFAAWFEDEVITALKDIKPMPPRTSRKQGVFFGGTWYTVEDLVLSVGAHLHMGEYVPLGNVLENLTSTWYRHWIVAYGLAEIRYNMGAQEDGIDLLVEAIGMRPFSLPLYRKLALWLDECGMDKSALTQLLQDQFGLSLESLEASPPPTAFEVLGIDIQQVLGQQAEAASHQANEVLA